jgi:S1-C subfamily serine protease
MNRRLVALALLLAATTSLRAQRGVDPDEFVHLEPVLRAALLKAAPFTVSVDTFGGGRRSLAGGEQNLDGLGGPPPKPKDDKPDKPEDKPGEKPVEPKPEPKPEGDKPAQKPEDQKPEEKPADKPDGDKPDEKDKKPKPKMVLATPGFHQTQGKTTGVIMSSDGWILVSRFALNFNPTTILITLADGRTFHAERMGEDTSRGIALVKVQAKDLPHAEFVPPQGVKVGQWAFALGRTFATDEPTVHIGIVSAVRRQFGRALQIDAYTSPANYGGPVIDVDGRVLGISTPLSPAGRDAGVEWYDSGIGFAATIADIPELLARMKQGDVVHRGWLGITMEPAHFGPGAVLQTVAPTGAAEKAGLLAGDTILEVDGVAVKNSFGLQMLVGSHMGGDCLHLKVQRKDETTPREIDVKLADTPIEEREKKKDAELPPSFPLPDKK